MGGRECKEFKGNKRIDSVSGILIMGSFERRIKFLNKEVEKGPFSVSVLGNRRHIGVNYETEFNHLCNMSDKFFESL
jgi:hypothetical protein